MGDCDQKVLNLEVTAHTRASEKGKRGILKPVLEYFSAKHCPKISLNAKDCESQNLEPNQRAHVEPMNSKNQLKSENSCKILRFSYCKLLLIAKRIIKQNAQCSKTTRDSIELEKRLFKKNLEYKKNRKKVNQRNLFVQFSKLIFSTEKKFLTI